MPSHGKSRSGGRKGHVVPQTDRTDRPSKPSGFRSSVANAPDALIYGVLAVTCIFGITFLIVGSVHAQKCELEPMLPIWLLVMGIIVAFQGCWFFFLVLRIKREPFRSINVIEKIVTVAFITLYFAWFIAGNVWVYRSWGEHPDYGHTWFSNGCDKSVFLLSFVAIIVMDALVGLVLIGFCFWGMTKVVVKE